MMTFTKSLLAAVSALAFGAVPLAATEMAATITASDDDDRYHRDLGSDIIVTAPYVRDRQFVLSGVSILEAEELVRDRRPTLGETLVRQPGVSTTYFGPGASRPVLRGFQGERVRMLTDGIGAFDVSNTSADHAVAINPLTVDRIEVIRGPAALLYGSSAIGGVVNATDRRIPRTRFDEPVHAEALAGFGSAADERSIAGMIDLPLPGSGLVVHADASYLRAGDVRTGGFILSPALRREAIADGHPADETDMRGRLDNSFVRTWDVAGGLAWQWGADNVVGLSVSRLASRYGIPNRIDFDHDHDHDHGHGHGHSHGSAIGPRAIGVRNGGHGHDHDHAHAHEDVLIDLRQTRIDGVVDFALAQGPFERFRVRAGWADYVHDEIDDDGDIETTFLNKAGEVRLELAQREVNGWRGAVGGQFFWRDFDAFGEEAYVPKNRTDQLGLFTLQEADLGVARVEGALRFETTRVDSEIASFRRRFNALSGSVGASTGLGEAWRLGGAVSHAQRAPAAEELLADGPHVATQAFEIGDPDLAKERSTGAELVLRGRGATAGGQRWNVEASAYATRFSNFIYLSETEEFEEGLPVFVFIQRGANFIGFEAQGDLGLGRFQGFDLSAYGVADYVRATFRDGGGPVPRIPPLRLLGGLEGRAGDWVLRAEVERSFAQRRTAELELETPGHTLVSASVGFRPFGPGTRSLISLEANNIFDVEARRHASYLKDFAPLPGRDIRISAQLVF